MTPGNATSGKALMVAPEMHKNSLGRTYAVWLLLRHLGYDCTVVAASPQPVDVWEPIRGTEFAAACRSIVGSTSQINAQLTALIDEHDVLMSTKALPESFGVLMPLAAKLGRRVILDNDDPDLEGWQRGFLSDRRLILRYGRHPVLAARFNRSRWLLSHHRDSIEMIVSNPWLQNLHGGVVIPHVREDLGFGAPHVSDEPTVAFIGTVRPHKGVDDLRAAIQQVGGMRLVVTDSAPDDARANEDWRGHVPFNDAMQLLKSADISVIPSRIDPFSMGQLPAKLTDSMMTGRMTIASELPPARWAVADAGLLFPPGDVSALADALSAAKDPGFRREYGGRARDRALQHFSVEAVAPALAPVVEAVRR